MLQVAQSTDAEDGEWMRPIGDPCAWSLSTRWGVGHSAKRTPACEQGMELGGALWADVPLCLRHQLALPGFVRPETRASGNVESSDPRNLQIVSTPLNQRLALSAAVANMPFPVRHRTSSHDPPAARTALIEPASADSCWAALHQNTSEPQLTTAVPDCPPPDGLVARVQEPPRPEVSASFPLPPNAICPQDETSNTAQSGPRPGTYHAVGRGSKPSRR